MLWVVSERVAEEVNFYMAGEAAVPHCSRSPGTRFLAKTSVLSGTITGHRCHKSLTGITELPTLRKPSLLRPALASSKACQYSRYFQWITAIPDSSLAFCRHDTTLLHVT